MTRPLAVVLLLAIAALGCADDPRQKDLADCRASLAAAKQRLDDVENGAPRLLAAAKVLAERGMFAEARAAADQLRKKHPDANESTEAAKLIGELEPKIRAAEAERQKADSARQAADKKRVDEATKLMVERKDEVQGISFFRHKDSAKFLNTRTDVQLYFAAKGGRAASLFFRIQYVADDWLFVKRITLKADDQILTIEPSATNGFERDHGEGLIWEWLSGDAQGYRSAINAIINAKAVTVRFEGQQYQKDRKLSDVERARLAQVITAYSAMGGTW